VGDFGWTEIALLACAAAFTAWVLAIAFLVHADRRDRRRIARDLWAECGGRGPDGQPLRLRACPNCMGPMRPGFVLVGGGVMFSLSREVLAGHCDPDLSADERERLDEATRRDPPTVLIGSGGYLQGYGNWPKEGLYCAACDTFAVIDCADRRHRAAVDDANRPSEPPQPPPAVGPEVTTPGAYVCCICRLTTPGADGAEHPLDPCSLALTTNINKHQRYQRHGAMFCHFECLRRVTADGLLDMMFPPEPTGARGPDSDHVPIEGPGFGCGVAAPCSPGPGGSDVPVSAAPVEVPLSIRGWAVHGAVFGIAIGVIDGSLAGGLLWLAIAVAFGRVVWPRLVRWVWRIGDLRRQNICLGLALGWGGVAGPLVGSGLGALSPLLGVPVSALGGALAGLLVGPVVLACEGALVGAAVTLAARLLDAFRSD
jgi:hypothetical protein